uniref:RRM domain-containing protein n=1 Tax=Chenopodium quinoa TaxID=63459 RepID=A0A803N587_CHEQI
MDRDTSPVRESTPQPRRVARHTAHRVESTRNTLVIAGVQSSTVSGTRSTGGHRGSGRQPGYKQMKVLRQERHTVCFIEFEDLNSASHVHHNLQGAVIPSSGSVGMRIQYPFFY